MAGDWQQVENAQGQRFVTQGDIPPGVKLVQQPQTEVPARAQVPQGSNIEQVRAEVGAGPGMVTGNEMAALQDPRDIRVKVGAIKPGDVKTTSSVSTKEGVKDDPLYAAYRAESLAQKQGIAEQQADLDIQANERKRAMLEGQAAEQKIEVDRLKAEATRRELEVDNNMKLLDTTIQQHMQQWQRGSSTGAELFDGSFGAGNMLSVIGITLAGMGGPEYQANAMSMVNKSLDRAIESQKFGINSMFNQLKNRFGSAEIARESLKAMQIKYAETMANLYASQNASPQIAINLARFQNQLNDEYMKTEDTIRRLSADQVDRKQDYRWQAGRKAGEVPLDPKTIGQMLDNQNKFLEGQKRAAALIGNGGPDEPPPTYKKDQPVIKQAVELDKTYNNMEAVLLEAGAPRRTDGSIDLDQVMADVKANKGDLTGISWYANMAPEILQFGESGRIHNAVAQAVRQMVIANRKGTVSAAAAEKEADEIMGGWTEGDQVGRLVNAMAQNRRIRDTTLMGAAPESRHFYNKNVDAGRAELFKQSDESLGGEEMDYNE